MQQWNLNAASKMMLIATTGLYWGRRHVLIPINRHFYRRYRGQRRQLHQTGRGTGERWGDGSRHRLCRSGRFSAHSSGLQYLGLELPEDRYGAILRYQTDHDEAGRATSCGPRTSRLMVKVLLEEVQRLAIPVLTSATVIKLLHQRDENGKHRGRGNPSRPVIAPITHGGWQL